jgi:hypothetical protein
MCTTADLNTYWLLTTLYELLFDLKITKILYDPEVGAKVSFLMAIGFIGRITTS